MLDIEVSNVKLNFGLKNVLDGVTFQVNSGEKIAIVGENGSGKTSIFNLISGNEKPTSGLVIKRKDLTVGLLTQIPPKVSEEMTVREFLKDAYGELGTIHRRMSELEIKMSSQETSEVELERFIKEYGKLQDRYAMNGGYEIDANVEKMSANLHITEFLEQAYSCLSGGQKIIVSLCRLLLVHPDVLLLDEPTNHLDMESLEWLENFIKGYNGSVILVSHDRYFLDRTIEKILALSDGKVKTYFGNYSKYIEQLASEREAQQQAYVTQQKEIAGLRDTIRKNRTWGTQSSEKAYRVAKQLERRIDEMEKVERPKEQRGMALNFNQETRSGKDVLKFDNVCFAYDESEDFILFDSTFELQYRDKVCIVGKNGSGKSTILKIIIGAIQNYSGNVLAGSNVKLAYLPQHVVFDNENLTVLEEFQRNFVGTVTQAYSTLAAFHFFGEEVNKRISSLSGGEKVRLKFAELVQNDVNFLILDEPTNHLDVKNREILEEALTRFGGTILFVSHDRYFINKIATRVIEIEDCKLTNYIGDYDYYKEHKDKI